MEEESSEDGEESILTESSGEGDRGGHSVISHIVPCFEDRKSGGSSDGQAYDFMVFGNFDDLDVDWIKTCHD